VATKETIISGMQQVIAEAKRVGAILDESGDWDVERQQGWTPKQMLSHVAAVGGMLPMSAPMLLSAAEDADFTQSTDIGALNAQSVAAMKDMSGPQIVQALEANYGKAIEWVKTLPDEQLALRRTFAKQTNHAGDILETISVLHANHHLYEAVIRIPM